MLETRAYKISRRIFTLDSLKQIALILEKEYKDALKKRHYASLSFSVKFEDGSKYETEDTKLFDQDIIKSKRVKGVEFYFRNRRNNKKIEFSLMHGDYSSMNEIVISGADSDWVNGRLTRLKEIVEASQPQFNLIHRFSLLLTIFFSLSIGISFLFFAVSTLRFANSKPFINIFKLTSYDTLFFVIFFVGFFPALFIVDWLKRIFPNIEIQIGPNHSFIEANRRKVLSGIITILLIPLILAFI